MFQITDRYHGPAGHLRFSRVRDAASFSGRTSGLALKYVRRGEEVYRLGSGETWLAAGQLLLLPADYDFAAGHPHRDRRTEGICIDLPLPVAGAVDLLYATPFAGAAVDFTVLDELAFGADPPTVLRDCGRAIQSFAGRVAEWDDRLRGPAKKLATRRALLQSLLAARDYLRRHATETVALAQLARRVGMSPYHLSRLFTRCFGSPPLTYQHALRMERAAEILARDPAVSLSQLALALGYADLAAFSRRFRARFGVPPSRWREGR